MNKLWLLPCLPALAWSALALAGQPSKSRETQTYRCDLGRTVVALQRERSVSLMVQRRTYDLVWVSDQTARGAGLEWRFSAAGATLKRDSSGSTLVSGCQVH
jgi:hypothetical protein